MGSLLFASGVLACGNSESASSDTGPSAGTTTTTSPATTTTTTSDGSGGATSTTGNVTGGGTQSTSDSSTGGTTGTAGSGTGGGGSDITLHEACVIYYKAACNRQIYECRGREPIADPCPYITEECPDLVNSEGSNVTVEQLLDCAERNRNLSCEDFFVGLGPGCEFAVGSLEAGEPCITRNQCADDHCVFSAHPADNCGLCALPKAPGEECVGYDECGPGVECQDGYCVPIPPYAAEGAPCERYGRCQYDTYCVQLPSDPEPICQPLPSAGEPCPTDVARCASGSYCDEEGMCQASPGSGMPCTNMSNALGPCAEGLVCVDGPDGTGSCGPPREPGETCTPLPDITAPTANCIDGTTCVCDDDTCTSGVCYDNRSVGDSCGGPYDLCIDGTVCEGGICNPVDSLGLYTAYCTE